MSNVMTIVECVCSQVQNNSSPSVTDWMMVVITVVYVIATVLICIANFSSAKASKEQLEESKRQYEDSKRLECMPCFNIDIKEPELPSCFMEIDVTKSKKGALVLSSKKFVIENIGKGIAKNITCSFHSDIADYKEVCKTPIIPINNKDGTNIIFCGIRDILEDNLVHTSYFEFIFEDLLDNKYQQNIEIEYILGDKKDTTLYIQKKQISMPYLLEKEGKTNV